MYFRKNAVEKKYLCTIPLITIFFHSGKKYKYNTAIGCTMTVHTFATYIVHIFASYPQIERFARFNRTWAYSTLRMRHGLGKRLTEFWFPTWTWCVHDVRRPRIAQSAHSGVYVWKINFFDSRGLRDGRNPRRIRRERGSGVADVRRLLVVLTFFPGSYRAHKLLVIQMNVRRKRML